MERQCHRGESWPALKTLGVVTLLVLGVARLEAEDSWLRSAMGLLYHVSAWCLSCTGFSCGNALLRSPQVRNYTECACVQSRQVITPPTVGQRSQLRLVIVKTYLNENGYAVSGKCDRTCNTLIPFLIFLFIVTLITACAQPSAIIVTLRWEQGFLLCPLSPVPASEEAGAGHPNSFELMYPSDVNRTGLTGMWSMIIQGLSRRERHVASQFQVA